MTDRPLRVLIVDDHEVVREGLRSLLNRREGITIVGDAGSVAAAIEEAARLRPDVVIMDARLPAGSRGGARRGGPPDARLASLSEQEQKILPLIAEGKTNKEIAEEIFLSDKTVKNYVSSILSKLNLRRRAEAAAFIARKGLLKREEGKQE